MSTITQPTPTAARRQQNGLTSQQIRAGIGGAIAVGGLVLMVANQMNVAYLLLGLLLGLLVWKPFHGILVAYSIISVYPVLRIVSISLRPSTGLLSRSLDIIPAGATLQSYNNLFNEEPFLQWAWNSLSITVTVSIIGVAVAATGAYAFSRWRFFGRRPALIFFADHPDDSRRYVGDPHFCYCGAVGFGEPDYRFGAGLYFDGSAIQHLDSERVLRHHSAGPGRSGDGGRL